MAKFYKSVTYNWFVFTLEKKRSLYEQWEFSDYPCEKTFDFILAYSMWMDMCRSLVKCNVLFIYNSQIFYRKTQQYLHSVGKVHSKKNCKNCSIFLKWSGHKKEKTYRKSNINKKERRELDLTFHSFVSQTFIML